VQQPPPSAPDLTRQLGRPGALALSVKDTVKLGATHRDGSAVRQGDTTAGCINGRDKVAFRHQIRFDEQFDLVHARTTALGTVTYRHPELTEQTIWEVFEGERSKLVPYASRTLTRRSFSCCSLR